MTQKFGRGPVLLWSIGLMLTGVLISVFSSIWLVFVGMMLFTTGFFAAHSVASSWIGKRAKRAKGQASALYLFFYYVGSSIAGTLGGFFWHNYGWNGLAVFLAAMLICALFIGRYLARLPEASGIKA